MLSTLIDLIVYAGGLMFAGICLFAGIFLSVSAYYFITDLLKGSN